jgi:transposase, IS30 family
MAVCAANCGRPSKLNYIAVAWKSSWKSSWQRGTNENTNLLLRQYFPRGTDLSPISQAQLDQVSVRLNQRPRKTLGFQTPTSKLQVSVASTV